MSASTQPCCWCGGEIVEYYVGAEPSCSESPFHDPLATGIVAPEDVRVLYLAGPMSGIEHCNYPRFNEVAGYLRDAGFIVLNPAEISAGTRAHYRDYLRSDLRAMLDCQGIATLEGWEFSHGARNEVACGGILGMPVRHWGDWASQGCTAS